MGKFSCFATKNHLSSTPLNANDGDDGVHDNLTEKKKRPEHILDSIAVDILSVLPQKEDRNFDAKKLRKNGQSADYSDSPHFYKNLRNITN